MIAGRAKFAALGASLFALASCNVILGFDDFRGPSDGDGGADVDATDEPPPAPMLRAPRFGATTGSFRATASLRPRFAWRATPGASHYEIAVDDSCQTSSFRTCLFPSPEILETGFMSTTFTPPADLAVSMSAPVGRRYFWRVRACNDHGCSDWSDVWYLDVGRLADDVNGDGYGDLVIGIRAETGLPTEIGTAYVAFGRGTAGPVATTRLAEPNSSADTRFGSAVAMVGDVNADGYGDVVVGSWKDDEGTRTGLAHLYLGQGTWPATLPSPSTTLVLAVGAPATAFGGAIAGRGDVNGDGYGDIAIAAVPVRDEPTLPGYVYVDFGRATWATVVVGSELVVPDPAGETTGGFGVGLTLDDINEDGRADVIVGAPYAGTFEGRAAAYFAPSEIPSTPYSLDTADVSFPSPALAGQAMFGFSVSVCAAVGNSPVVAIGAPIESMPAAMAGVERLYMAPEGWPMIAPTPSRVLPEPTGVALGSMGIAARCGDVNGDQAPDLIVGAPTGDGAGAIYIFDDASSLPTSPLATLAPGTTFGLLGNGLAVTDFDGDGVLDVFGGAPNQPAGQAGRVLGWLGRSQWPTASSTPDVTIDNPSGIAGEKFGVYLD